MMDVAILCNGYLTVRKCLQALVNVAVKHSLKHEFILKPAVGVQIQDVRFILFGFPDDNEQELNVIEIWDAIQYYGATHVFMDIALPEAVQGYLVDKADTSSNIYPIVWDVDFNTYVMENIIQLFGINCMIKPEKEEFRCIRIGEDF